jgi:hypothetical protein
MSSNMPVDRLEHSAGELIADGGGHHPRCGQIERDDADALGRELCLQFLPVGGREVQQPVDLFDEEHVAGVGIVEKAEQFGSRHLPTALILDIPRDD